MKLCRICQQSKEIEDFVKSKKFKSGYDTICLSCSRNKVKEYRKKNKKPHSKRKSISGGYRDIIVDFLIKRDGLICGMCRESLEGSEFHIDHIIPVALGGKDIMENVRLTHPKCNLSQSNLIRKQSHGY
jgi:5-methylcytosine-specific restriction endonuclease McrA